MQITCIHVVLSTAKKHNLGEAIGLRKLVEGKSISENVHDYSEKNEYSYIYYRLL